MIIPATGIIKDSWNGQPWNNLLEKTQKWTRQIELSPPVDGTLPYVEYDFGQLITVARIDAGPVDSSALLSTAFSNAKIKIYNSTRTLVYERSVNEKSIDANGSRIIYPDSIILDTSQVNYGF